MVADLAGFDVASRELLDTLGYQFSDRFAARPGYRHFKIDYGDRWLRLGRGAERVRWSTRLGAFEALTTRPQPGGNPSLAVLPDRLAQPDQRKPVDWPMQKRPLPWSHSRWLPGHLRQSPGGPELQPFGRDSELVLCRQLAPVDALEPATDDPRATP